MFASWNRRGAGRRFVVFAALSFVAFGDGSAIVRGGSSTECRFPDDPAVLDAKRDFGAKGDGKADDTEALQRAIEASSGGEGGRGRGTRALYLPNGVYRVTRTLVVNATLGPWLYGESRDGVVIKLDDGVEGVNSVLRTHPREEGPTSADWFMRNLRNFTIDVGNNPETDGIRYFATNTGILKNVRVIGNGKVGINAGFLGQSGPNLIQDVEVEGFETGILSQWIWGQTISRATIRDCRKEGLRVVANAVAVEELTVENTPTAVVCDYPNDWLWWGGVLSIQGGRFANGDRDGPAIRNRSVLHLRDVTTRGFGSAVSSETPGGNVAGPDVSEYLSHPVKSLSGAPERDFRLPIEREPSVAWETDPSKWVCANDFGAAFGDNADDSAAIQAAIDAAARDGKTTVHLRGIAGGDPNWYNVDRPIRVHGSVRSIIGLGFGRILGGAEGRFVVGNDAAPIVKFQNLDSFGGPPVRLVNASRNRTMVVESCGVSIVGEGRGSIFVTDCPADIELKTPGQKLWARQLNPEGDSDVGLVRNNGGDLWALGVKCEGRGVRFLTSNGGRTEIAGMFVYGPGIDPADERPIFDVADGSLRVAALREIAFDVPTYPVKVRERRGGVLKRLRAEDGEQGWIGWCLYRSTAP